MIYLDNSATTRKKPLSVKLSVLKNLTFSANPTRSSHKASFKMSLKVLNARNNLKSFFNAPKTANVIYTYNCTESLNTAILGTAKKDGHVIITAFEHNSVIRPLFKLTKTHNITFDVVTPNTNGIIDPKDIFKLVNKNTYLIIVNHVSNVTGAVTNLFPIGKFCCDNNILFLVDSAQSAGHEIIDMEKFNINMLCIAGHKGLLAPQGIGALIINNACIEPIKFGGSGSNSLELNMPNEYPDKLEAGTINTLGIMGLNAGIKFVSKKFKKINSKTSLLTTYLINNLKQVNNVKLYSNNCTTGVVSFSFLNIDNNEAQNILNEKFNICVRTGLHCAPLIHKHLKTTKSGLVRVSISYYNSLFEIKKLIKAVKYIALKK